MADAKKSVNPLEAGVIGAIIGAAATAAAVVLSDEKNRKKAEKILSDLQNKGDRIIKEISKKAMELKDSGLKALPKPKKASKRRKE